MKTSKFPPLPTPEIIPGIMELIRANKDRISLETFNMTYDEKMDYFARGRRRNPIWPEDAMAV
ncbi:hypothetical protein AGMMS4957_15690 [Bacteroidia bacterium]|nr:hypothetical protein AGMMS4957_15690 [Bacteroidia bacterium]